MPARQAAWAVARDPASLRDAAHGILLRPEFRQTPESPIDRLRRWVGNQIAKVLDAALSGHLTVIGVILLGLILALIVYLVVRFATGVQRDPSLGGVVVGGMRRPPAEWLAEAAACEARGDWRGALRARYRALVAELARRGLVEEIAGRTTGEYRQEVSRSLPGAADPFAGATDLFESTIYGDAPSGQPESARIQELADRVLAGAR